MKVFLTGGTGLLGGNVARTLVERGHEVTALVRSLDKGRQRLGPDVVLVEGDLTRPQSYASHLGEVEAVIHAAACYSEYYRTKCTTARLRDVNVAGTVGLLEAAHDLGVRRLVYVSSAGVLETKTGTPTDESAPYADPTDGPYFDSKVEAEKAVRAFAKEHGTMGVVLLLPTVMLGPGDTGPSPTGAVLQRVLQGKIDIVLPGAMNVVDVRDVAQAAVAALDRGSHGARYLIGGSRHTIKEIFGTLGEVSGKPTPTKSPPPAILKLVLGVRGLVARLQGKRPPLRPRDLDRLQRPFWFSSAAAQRDLGVHYRPLAETLTDVAAWFLDRAAGSGTSRYTSAWPRGGSGTVGSSGSS